MALKELSNYLIGLRAELQEMYEELDSELRNTENQKLIDDSYHNVTSKFESALSEFDTLINDVDGGIYDNEMFNPDYDNDGTSEVEE